jgi:two-component system NtrC family sensor kinase
MQIGNDGLVTTIRERCRRCFACVRECPVDAIQILDGQASVIDERCIGCGNCFAVCSQNAKQAYSDVEKTFGLLSGTAKVAAIVAPSFPAEFPDLDEGVLVALLHKLGFASVHEVAFGADLVAREYRALLEQDADGRYIATPCPAVVSFVRKYHPGLLDSLAPIVSPMIAMARVVRAASGAGTKVVFVGPCIAKKGEAAHDEVSGEIDAVLTFTELHQMLDLVRLEPSDITQPLPFDPPHGSLGSLFPLARGLLQAADLQEDLLTADIVAADGRDNFADAVGDFAHADSDVRLLDILTCQGCIGGVGFTRDEPLYRRRAEISRHARTREAAFDDAVWRRDLEHFSGVDLGRTYSAHDQRFSTDPTDDELEAILARMGKFTTEDQLNCGACGYESCVAHAVAVYHEIAEIEMCLPYLVERLSTTVDDLEESHRSLESTKEALIKSEKLASMGQLAAGIAHEVNNPLGILLLQANILLEEIEGDGGDPAVQKDLELIVDQANRCKKIISGLLNFARQSRVVRQPTDIGELVADTVRTVPFESDVTVEVAGDLDDPVAEVDSDQMVQVLVNLLTNAQQAMPDGGTISVELDGDDDEVEISVSDTGVGIPAENLDKLFDPFFTTKQVGKGTGLGLAVTHGIVKMHRGQIVVHSNADPHSGATGTTFTITLPRHEV